MKTNYEITYEDARELARGNLEIIEMIRTENRDNKAILIEIINPGLYINEQEGLDSTDINLLSELAKRENLAFVFSQNTEENKDIYKKRDSLGLNRKNPFYVEEVEPSYKTYINKADEIINYTEHIIKSVIFENRDIKDLSSLESILKKIKLYKSENK